MNVRKRPPLLVLLLGAVFVLFIAILLFTWIATDRAHPVILDERGQRR